MALLLSIETSTHHFSCALHRDEKLIGLEESKTEQSTASLLAVMIEKLFSESPLKKEDLNAVIVSSGPGSYTGLRIGVATAKGICYALDLPLISVSTLFLMAHQFVQQFEIERDSLLCSMLDARRMEVYCLLVNQELKIVRPTEAKVIDELSFADVLSERIIYFFGEGADKCQETIRHANARFISDIRPSASVLGEIGYQKFLRDDCEDISSFEPFYLKDFVIKKPNRVS